jgi:hypothetical protein
MASVITFHVYPVPKRAVVTVMVTESGQGMAAGDFEVTAVAWERVRRCLRPGPGCTSGTTRPRDSLGWRTSLRSHPSPTQLPRCQH